MNRTLTHTTLARTKSARTTLAALTAAAVSVTIGAISLAVVSLGGPASAQGHGDDHAHSTTTHYVLRDGQFAMDDLGQPGEGLGDILVQSQPVVRHGKTVGHIHDTATAVAPKGSLWQANGTLVLRGGTIEYAGLISHSPHFTMAITGGTGKYQDASGQMVFEFPGNRQLLTMNLTP